MNPLSELLRTLRSAADLIYPNLCPVCERPLIDGEPFFCASCAFLLPRMPLGPVTDNPVCDRLAGQIPFDRAAAFLRYEKGSSVQILFERFKYGDEYRLAFQLGVMAAMYWTGQGLFDGVDALVPVPLHPARKAYRGYNQSEWIVRGMASVSGLPSDMASLERTVATDTQTRKGVQQRHLNMEGVFALSETEAGCCAVKGKHLMLVDDVLTTGATLISCGKTLLHGGADRVSFFALAMA